MAAKSVPGKQWGNDQSNANDAPDWGVYADGVTTPNAKVDSAGLTRQANQKLSGGASANVGASGSGWTLQMPGAEGVGEGEILVAIGGLKMPALTVLSIQDLSGTVGHSNAEFLKVILQLSSGATVESNVANVYITAIGDDANTTSPNLFYSVADSLPASGVLVFESGALDLTSIDDNSTFTINSSATLHGVIDSRKKKDGALALTGGLPDPGVTITIVYP